MALSRGAGAIVGILGSFAFSGARRRLGLDRTGAWALAAQMACNMLAVLSVFLPGSPFDPFAYFSDERPANMTVASEQDDDVFAGRTANVSHLSIIVFLVGIVLARFGDFFTAYQFFS